MKDQFQRDIHYLRLSVTDRCNLRCIYCMPECGIEKKGHQDILSFESTIRIVKAASRLGIHKVRITGGEPLVRRNVVGLIEQIKGTEGIQSVHMTTNGILLKAMAKDLKSAGLDRINISLDTLNPERYREITRGGDLQSVLEGITAARSVGFNNIKFNVVLIGGFNTDELNKFIQLSQQGIDVRFIELMPIGEAATWAKERFVSADSWLRDAGLTPLETEKTDGPARHYGNADGTVRVGIINPISSHFCGGCNRIRITSDGKLKNCLHSDTETDLTPYIDDEDLLLSVMKQAVHLKPKAHTMNDPTFSPIHRDMYKIGG